jgi:uncharacterized protein (DUF433 family)
MDAGLAKELWKDCDIVETVPGKLAGQPVIKNTRVRAQTIVDNFDSGSSVEEIAENYPSVPVDNIRKLIDYAHAHQPQPVENPD